MGATLLHVQSRRSLLSGCVTGATCTRLLISTSTGADATRYDALAICTQTNAATKLFDKYIDPFLKTHEEKIDAKVAEGFELASSKFAALKAQVTQVAKEGSADAAADTPSKPKLKKVAHAD